MSVGAVGPVHGPGPVDPREQIRAVELKEALLPIQDRLEISEAGRLVMEAMEVDPVRADRIEELRRSIEAGLFDTPERLEAAVIRFLEQQG